VSSHDPAEATRFLIALGHALSSAQLYGSDHPARAKASAASYTELRSLMEVSPNPRFSSLGDEIIFGRLAIRSLKDWSTASRLSKAGIQWLEFDDTVTPADLKGFIADASWLLSLPAGTPAADPLLYQRPGISWGMVAIAGSDRVSEDNPLYDATGGGRGAPRGFAEELEATRWIAGTIAKGSEIPLAEAQAVIRSLAVALQQDRDILQPVFSPASPSDPSAHAVGVANLAMALGEQVGMSRSDTRALGVAALLHDVGLTRIPAELVTSDAPLTAKQDEIYRQHAIHGARMMLESENDLSLAALVAYEHHMQPDGKGYPQLRFPRETHRASRIVAICSGYHAARSGGHGTAPMDSGAALRLIEKGAGTVFDAELAQQFVTMMRILEARTALAGN
jgi:putative nucleotidyltransferase with HDIG domain